MIRYAAMMIAFSLSACGDSSDLERKEKEDNGDPVIIRNQTTTGEGVTTAKVTDSETTHSMQADGVNVLLPPGVLAVGAEVSMQPGADIVTDTTVSDLGLDSDIEKVSGAMVVTSGETVEAPTPFTISLPLTPEAALVQDEADPHANLVVIFKMKNVGGEGSMIKTFLREKLKIADNKVQFETIWFGSYQLARTAKRMTEDKTTIVASPIMTQTAMQNMMKDRAITWDVSGAVLADRTIDYKFSVTGIGEPEACTALIDMDGDKPIDHMVPVGTPGHFVWKVAGDKARAFLLGFSCRSVEGLESGRSEWQKIEIPALTSGSNTSGSITSGSGSSGSITSGSANSGKKN